MASSLRSTGPAGPIILTVFGMVWAIMGLRISGAPDMLWLGPIAIGIALIILVLRRSRGMAPPPAEEGKRIGKLVGIWSAVEGVGIFLAINICSNVGRPDLIMASICLIVGLHFVPLARGLPVPLYYTSAALLSGLGIAGLVASAIAGPAIVAIGAALVLWGTVLRILT